MRTRIGVMKENNTVKKSCTYNVIQAQNIPMEKLYNSMYRSGLIRTILE